MGEKIPSRRAHKEKGESVFTDPPVPNYLVLAALEGGDVRRLQALRALGHFELNRLPIVQGLVTVRLNR
jgi:hypothetical protein